MDINKKSHYTLYVIVVTYNAQRWIPYFGDPLKILPKDWKVIVIDNASVDATCTIIEKKYPNFFLIRSSKNLGFGKANNIGLRLALEDNVDHVFLLNQDATITVAELQHLLEIQQKHSEFFIVSPVHLNGAATDLDQAFATYCLPDHCPQLYSDALQGKMREIYSCNMGNAAAWLLSRECLVQIGGFNPLFGHYGEDDEFRCRVLYHGYKMGIAPMAFARHDRENRSPAHPLATFKERMLVGLLDLSNPHPFFFFVRDTIQLFLKKMFQFRIAEGWKILSIFMQLLSHWSDIRRARMLIKNLRPNFLDTYRC